MSFFERGDVRIHYTVTGDPEGEPLLLVAPGGLRSAIERWRGAPFDPLERLQDFRLIAMDQRNAGRSTGPIPPGAGWSTYAADQLALLDHLGVQRFHFLGMCIGGAYGLALACAVPRRVRSAVLLQPIGLHDNRAAFLELFDRFRAEIASDHPEADEQRWASFRRAMFGGDFVFAVGREDAARCEVPVLLCMGSDLYHPEPISRELASVLPEVTLVERWKEDPATTERVIRQFLQDAPRR